MAIFNSYVSHYQRVCCLWQLRGSPGAWLGRDHVLHFDWSLPCQSSGSIYGKIMANTHTHTQYIYIYTIIHYTLIYIYIQILCQIHYYTCFVILSNIFLAYTLTFQPAFFLAFVLILTFFLEFILALYLASFVALSLACCLASILTF